MEHFYIAQLWIWLFEVANNLMKLLHIAKFDLADGFYSYVSNLCNFLYFTQIYTKLFSSAQILLKLLDHTQTLLIYTNVSNFTQNLNDDFYKLKFGEGCWNSSSLKGSDYFAIRGKNEWQNNLKKAFSLDAL